MQSGFERSTDRITDGSDTPRLRNRDDARAWPRCEPALTHFELGASPENQPTALMAKRYTPRYGVRKE
jgi:hypothetical protein